MQVPDAPGLDVDIDEEAIANYPTHGNISALGQEEFVYFQARQQRAAWAGYRGTNSKEPAAQQCSFYLPKCIAKVD